MAKPVILFNREGLYQLKVLSDKYLTVDIHKKFYDKLSRQLIYKSVDRAKLYHNNPSEKVKRFLLPKWVDDKDNCILKFRDDITDDFLYKNVFMQPVDKWVLVGSTINNDGRWYSKGTKRSELK